MVILHIGQREFCGILIVQIQTETKPGRIVFDFCIFCIIQSLRNRQGSRGIFADMIDKGNPLTIRNCGRCSLIIHSIFPRSLTGKPDIIRIDLIVNLRVYPAFHDLILDRVIRHIDDDCLAGVQKKHIFVFPSAHRGIFLHKFDRDTCILISNIDLVVRFILFAKQMKFFIVWQLIINLICIFRQFIVLLLCARNLFVQNYLPWFNRREIKPHMEIRRACAALHIENLHGMGGVIFKHILSVFVLFKNTVEVIVYLLGRRTPITFLVILLKNFIKRCRIAVYIDLTRPVVDRTRQSTVDTAQVNHQFAVHIEPKIVITGKFVNDVVPPGIQSAGRLNESCLDFHTEIVVRF